MTFPPTKDIYLEEARELAKFRAEAAVAAKLEAEADMLGEHVATEKENRRLRFGIAIAALP